MRKPLTLAAIVCSSTVIFASCSKSSGSSSSPVKTTFTFTRNGTSVDWSSTLDTIQFWRIEDYTGVYHVLEGVSYGTPSPLRGIFQVKIPAPSVVTGVWNSAVFLEVYTSIQFSNVDVNDPDQLVITSVHDGRIDGTFQGNMSGYLQGDTTTITNGVFNNVLIKP